MQPLTILYTHALRGDLDLLPRLYSFLSDLRWEVGGSRSAPTEVVLLDLGDSCAPEVWPCALTEGRSTLIALDAMGYHAANVEGVLASDSRDKLAEQVSLALVDAPHPHLHKEHVALICGSESEIYASAELIINLVPAQKTMFDGHILTLTRLEAGKVGMAQLSGHPLTLVSYAIYVMPPATLPDPTIAGVVDFIRAEARYFESHHP